MEDNQQQQQQWSTTRSAGAKKTRNRVPMACDLCRRRKRKCSREKPHCAACVRDKTTHLCHYEEQPWESSSEIQKLKEQIFQLQQQNAELKSLLNTTHKTNRAISAYSMDSSEGLIIPDQPANDPVLELTQDFDLLMLKENKMSHYGSSSYMAIVSQDHILKDMFGNFLNAQTWGINFEKFFLYDQGIMPMVDHGCVALAPTNTISVFETELTKNNEALVEEINKMLPQKQVVLDLIDHFFAGTYAFIPFLDETAFRKNMESLITVRQDGRACLLVSNSSLLVSVAILLTVLRFAFISLPLDKNNPSHNVVIQRIQNSNAKISPKFVEYAKACIANACVLRKPTFKHIQALLILRLYRFFAPEDGDESTDSTIFLALIVQMARIHGLHRDPTRFSMIKDHATISIWRKMWIELKFLDASQAMQFGCPLLIDDEYDTQLPVANAQDSPLEKSCIDFLIKLDEVTGLMRALIKASNKIHDPPKRSDIEMILKNVEFLVLKYRSFTELTQLYNPSETFLSKITKIKESILKLQLYSIHTIFNFILMLTCDSNEVSTFERYSTASAESSFIVFKFCHQYSLNPSQFNKTLHFETLMSASIFDTSKRVLQQLTSFALRDLLKITDLSKIVQNLKFPDSIGLDHWLTPITSELQVSDQLLIHIEEYIQQCSKMANRYFACWRLVFVTKLFEDYIDKRFPGKFEELHKKIQDYENNKPINKNRADGESVDILNLRQSVANFNNMNESLNELWEQFTEGGYSKFDYLVPELDKYDNIVDPYLNENFVMDPSGSFSFQDYNSFVDNINPDISNLNDPGTDFGYSGIDTFLKSTDQYNGFDINERNPSSTGDDVSPKTDSSDPTSVANIDENGLDTNEMRTCQAKTGVSDHDLAIQVARSMFGDGSSNDVEN